MCFCILVCVCTLLVEHLSLVCSILNPPGAFPINIDIAEYLQSPSVCLSCTTKCVNNFTILLVWRSKRWFSWSWSVQLFLPLCFYKNLLNRTKAFFTFFLPRKEIVNKIKCTKKMVVASMAMKIQQINKRIWLGSWKNCIWMVSSNLWKCLPTYLRFRTLISVCRIRIFYNTWKDWMIGNEG